MEKMMSKSYIPLVDCIYRHVYELHSRNLLLGVYDGNKGFIGIREKFGPSDRFLFTEYHRDIRGTVAVLKDTTISIPEDILICCSLGTLDEGTGRPMRLDPSIDNPNYPYPSKGWWRFTDGNQEIAPTVEGGCSAVNVSNKALFDFLNELEEKLVVRGSNWLP